MKIATIIGIVLIPLVALAYWILGAGDRYSQRNHRKWYRR